MSRSILVAGVAALLFGCGLGDARLEPADLNLLQGEGVDLKVFDGDEDITDEFTFEVEGAGLDIAGNRLGAREPGNGTVRAVASGGELKSSVTVAPLEQVMLQVPEGTSWPVGTTVQLPTVGRGGTLERTLTHAVDYDISDDRVATTNERGELTVVGAGSITITARIAGLASNEAQASATCGSYPAGNQDLGLNNTMPQLSWPAVWPDGTKGVLDMAQMSCPGMWQDTKTMLFVLSAGWCGPCTAYAQYLQGQWKKLNSLGMQLVIMEVQDYEGKPASTKFAYQHLDKITDVIPAIAIGDADTQPERNYVSKANYLRYFPTSFVVRTSDMKIIADQAVLNTYLPLEDIAKNPDADWSGGGAFKNKCTLGQEEPGEPNNFAYQAITVIDETVRGGICESSGRDIYFVALDGEWTATLVFDETKANFDINVWDADTEDLAIIGNQQVGSSNGTGVEEFSFEGAAYVAVRGVLGSSGPYELTITAK